jgi:DNA-binding NtrC family response regulator
MTESAKILLVDDEPAMLRYIRTLLEVDDYKVETASTGEEALLRVDKGLEPDLVLLDVLMPGIDGLETLEQLRQKRPGVKVVMLSCVNDTKKVVQAMRLGAQDYLTKPFQKAELDAVIDQCLGQGKTPVGGEVEEVGEDTFFIAASPAMRKIRSQAALVAHVDIPVLLLGESGTGKEVLARLIHKLSHRAHRTFLKVNCAAVPADLLESELFGYEPGAFTGATHAKPGKFELCNKGTILLDEIGEMPPQLQAKLLHVLQDQHFSRLGSRSVIKVDVRILAATNIDIPQALAAKRLREDLYYRLNAFTLHLPPLRERKEEIPILLAAAELQPRHDGTGGAGARGDSGGKGEAGGGLKSLARTAKDEAEGEAIRQALEQTNWNRKQAAALLQISYKALLYKIRQYGIAEAKGHHKLSAGA